MVAICMSVEHINKGCYQIPYFTTYDKNLLSDSKKYLQNEPTLYLHNITCNGRR